MHKSGKFCVRTLNAKPAGGRTGLSDRQRFALCHTPPACSALQGSLGGSSSAVGRPRGLGWAEDVGVVGRSHYSGGGTPTVDDTPPCFISRICMHGRAILKEVNFTGKSFAQKTTISMGSEVGYCIHIICQTGKILRKKCHVYVSKI